MRCRDHPLDEAATESGRAECIAHIEAFHFAVVLVDRPQRNAAGDGIAVACEQQGAARRRVVPRQTSKFLREVLEAEIDAERSLVLAQQRVHDCDVLGLRGFANLHHHASIIALAGAKRDQYSAIVVSISRAQALMPPATL